MLAEVGQFPPFFGRGSRLGAHAGLLITSTIVLVVSNLVDLSAIASVGSACSLVIFLLVGIAGYRLRSTTGARGLVVLVGISATAVVLAFFAVDTLRNARDVRGHRRDRRAGGAPRRCLEAHEAGASACVSGDAVAHANRSR